MKNIKRLGDAELEIMQIVWARPEPMTSKEILNNLTQRQWKLSTLMTTLERLVDKGYLACDRSTRTNFYSRQIEECDYKANESKLLLEKLHGNSLSSLVSFLCDSNSVDKEDIAELRSYLASFAVGESSD